MVTLHVGGTEVGTLADAERLIPEFIARNYPIEFRDEAGTVVGKFIPVQRPTPPDPVVPWEPDLTEEELQRRLAGEFVTFDELKKRLGWE